MKFKLPSIVRIGPIYYAVSEVSKEKFMSKGSGREDLLGEVDTHDSTIRIREDISDQAKMQVFIHEVIHGCKFAGGTFNGHNEIHVDLIATGLMGVFLENDGLTNLVTDLRKLPDMVKVGPYYYAVSLVAKNYFMGEGSGREALLGVVYYHDVTIRIREDISDQMKILVFLSQIIHAVITNGGFIEGHDEMQVELIASMLMGVLLDNKGLFDLKE